jgi:membrane protein insertase Oxa1/YidC/SpoIIIJ
MNALSSSPVNLACDTLCSLRDVSGMPWGLLIISTTISLRILAMLPAHAFSQKVSLSDKFVKLDLA